jgi:hypothetical protein
MKKIILTLSLLAFVTAAFAGEGCPFAKEKAACTVKDKATCPHKKAEGCSTNKVDSATAEKPADDGKK